MQQFGIFKRIALALFFLSIGGFLHAEVPTESLSKESYPTYAPQPAQALPKEITAPNYLPKTENPPEFDNNLSPEENADIWQRIKEGYAMPNANTNLVKQHEKAFTKQPTLINNIVDRSQKYLFHIVEEVQSRGMPTEIALLPMIESAYNPSAYSSAKAAGIWQFIPSTGKNYGLKQNWWVDNRRNITFATDAALSYLQKLHVMFGAWDLALAAYNAGEGTVRRAIEKNKKLGKPTNYASLDLPKETQNYVPKLQAIKNIMTNPANFGIKLKTIENKAYFTTVTAPSQIDAKLVAEFAEISYEEFIALNPSSNRPVIAANSDTQELLLPVDAVEPFYRNLSTYDKPLVNWKPYSVKAGELLSSIASKNDISVDKLKKINHLSIQNKFSKATIILVPNKKLADSVATETPQNSTIGNIQAQSSEIEPTEVNAESQLVETEVDISELQNAGNIDVKHLESMQNIQQNEAETKTVKVGNKQVEPKQKPALIHTVKNGETLDKIARKYKVLPKKLVNLNHLKKNQVKTGQKLIIKAATVVKNNTKSTSTNKNSAKKFSKAEINNAKNINKKNGKQTKTKSATKSVNPSRKTSINNKSTQVKKPPIIKKKMTEKNNANKNKIKKKQT